MAVQMQPKSETQKPTWLLCEYCIAAIRSRGEKLFVGETISQDIDTDEDGNWYKEYDDNEPIMKCSWCEEIYPELHECI